MINSKSINVPRKNTFILGDSILKYVKGGCLNKKMKSNVRSIPGTSTNGIVHHVKGCLEDIFPDTVILHHRTNDLKSGNTLRVSCYRHKQFTFIYTKRKNQSFYFRIGYQKRTISIKDGKK